MPCQTNTAVGPSQFEIQQSNKRMLARANGSSGSHGAAPPLPLHVPVSSTRIVVLLSHLPLLLSHLPLLEASATRSFRCSKLLLLAVSSAAWA